MARYYFSRCELDTGRHELRVAGITRRIEPQVFDLLRLFVERGDALVSRDELIEHIWKGRVVSDSAISVRVNAARKAVGDDGKRQAIIRTVPRRGFKLAVDVVRDDDYSMDSQDSGQSSASNGEDRPVLAVFPFGLSGTGEQSDYLSRGIADDIATELSRFHTIAVISTFSTFKQDTRAADTSAFAASLGATHTVTGNIQLNDARTRLTVQLGDVATNKCLWSERYDISMEEMFDAQDDAVFGIVGNLVSRLSDQQMAVARRKPTGKLSAYDCVLRGLRIYKGGDVSLDEARQAHFWFDRAVELDPDYARALAWRACAGANLWSNPPTEEDLEGPRRDMERAADIDPGDHEVHRLKGALHMISGEYEQGDYHLSKSVELNPNDANVLLRIGYYRSFLGDSVNALNYVDLAFQRNPLHPPWYWHDRGVVLFAHGDYKECLNNLIRSQSEIEHRYVYEAACHAALGDRSSAASTIREVVRLNDRISLKWLQQAYPYRCYRYRSSIKTLAGYLAEAGLS